MQPDFSKPAFSFVALASLSFESSSPRREFHSDYRCQARFEGSTELVESRIYFVGSDRAQDGTTVPVVMAFLESEGVRAVCDVGAKFVLHEGERTSAHGRVDGVSVR